MGDGHGGIDKVASSWTLRGWLLLRGPFVGGALRGLAQPLPLGGALCGLAQPLPFVGGALRGLSQPLPFVG